MAHLPAHVAPHRAELERLVAAHGDDLPLGRAVALSRGPGTKTKRGGRATGRRAGTRDATRKRRAGGQTRGRKGHERRHRLGGGR